MTPTMEQIDQLTDAGPQDQEFWEQYEHAAALERKPLPAPAAYTVRFPETFESGVRKTKDGRVYWEATLTLTLVDADEQVNGYEARYIRVNTLVKTADNRRFSDAADVLLNYGTGERPALNFGADVEGDQAKQAAQEWEEAFRRLAGQDSPHKVFLTWEGYDKKTKERLRSKAFGRGATRTKVLLRTDPNTGEEYPVYANLVLGFRGFGQE